jgi:hypothetical protein
VPEFGGLAGHYYARKLSKKNIELADVRSCELLNPIVLVAIFSSLFSQATVQARGVQTLFWGDNGLIVDTSDERGNGLPNPTRSVLFALPQRINSSVSAALLLNGGQLDVRRTGNDEPLIGVCHAFA